MVGCCLKAEAQGDIFDISCVGQLKGHGHLFPCAGRSGKRGVILLAFCHHTAEQGVDISSGGGNHVGSRATTLVGAVIAQVKGQGEASAQRHLHGLADSIRAYRPGIEDAEAASAHFLFKRSRHSHDAGAVAYVRGRDAVLREAVGHGVEEAKFAGRRKVGLCLPTLHGQHLRKVTAGGTHRLRVAGVIGYVVQGDVACRSPRDVLLEARVCDVVLGDVFVIKRRWLFGVGVDLSIVQTNHHGALNGLGLGDGLAIHQCRNGNGLRLVAECADVELQVIVGVETLDGDAASLDEHLERLHQCVVLIEGDDAGALAVGDEGLRGEHGSSVFGGDILHLGLVVAAACEVGNDEVAGAVGVGADEAVPSVGERVGEAGSLRCQGLSDSTIDLAVIDDSRTVHHLPLREALALCGVHGIELRAVDAVVVGLFAEGHLAGSAHGDHADAVVDVGPVGIELRHLLAVCLHAAGGVVEGALRTCELIGGDGQHAAAASCDGAALQSFHMVHIDDGIAGCGCQHEAVLQGGIVGVDASVHREGVVFQVVDAAHDGCGVGALAADVVPSQEVTRVVGAVGADNLIAVGRGVGEVAGVAAQPRAP